MYDFHSGECILDMEVPGLFIRVVAVNRYIFMAIQNTIQDEKIRWKKEENARTQQSIIGHLITVKTSQSGSAPLIPGFLIF